MINTSLKFDMIYIKDMFKIKFKFKFNVGFLFQDLISEPRRKHNGAYSGVLVKIPKSFKPLSGTIHGVVT